MDTLRLRAGTFSAVNAVLAVVFLVVFLGVAVVGLGSAVRGNVNGSPAQLAVQAIRERVRAAQGR